MNLYVMVNDGTFVTADGYTIQDSNSLSLSALQEVKKWKIILDNTAYRINVNLDTKESE